MIKLFAVYKGRPGDEAAFWKHYNEVHVPLVMAVPGISRMIINKVVGSPMGEPPHFIIVEMQFPDQAAFDKAMQSPENGAAAADAANLLAITKGSVELSVAVSED